MLVVLVSAALDEAAMILERYIASNLVKGWLLVLLVLGAVFGLIGFIQELDHTRFDYNALAVARYTLFILPQQLVSLAPVIALLGSIVALASLDRFNELTIISCTGFSRARLLGAIALPTAVLMAVLWVCMEYVTPPLQQSAEAERQALRYRNQVRIPDGGVWSKSDNRYIHLDKMHKGGIPGDIDLFEFDDSGQLTRALHAETAMVSQEPDLAVRERAGETAGGQANWSRTTMTNWKSAISGHPTNCPP